MKPLPPFRFSHSQQTKNRVWDGRVENTEFDKRCRIPGGGKKPNFGGCSDFKFLRLGRRPSIRSGARPKTCHIYEKNEVWEEPLLSPSHTPLPFVRYACRHYVRNPFVAASIRDPTPHSPRRKEGGGGTNTFPTVTF